VWIWKCTTMKLIDVLIFNLCMSLILSTYKFHGGLSPFWVICHHSNCFILWIFYWFKELAISSQAPIAYCARSDHNKMILRHYHSVPTILSKNSHTMTDSFQVYGFTEKVFLQMLVCRLSRYLVQLA